MVSSDMLGWNVQIHADNVNYRLGMFSPSLMSLVYGCFFSFSSFFFLQEIGSGLAGLDQLEAGCRGSGRTPPMHDARFASTVSRSTAFGSWHSEEVAATLLSSIIHLALPPLSAGPLVGWESASVPRGLGFTQTERTQCGQGPSEK